MTVLYRLRLLLFSCAGAGGVLADGVPKSTEVLYSISVLLKSLFWPASYHTYVMNNIYALIDEAVVLFLDC